MFDLLCHLLVVPLDDLRLSALMWSCCQVKGVVALELLIVSRVVLKSGCLVILLFCLYFDRIEFTCLRNSASRQLAFSSARYGLLVFDCKIFAHTCEFKTNGLEGECSRLITLAALLTFYLECWLITVDSRLTHLLSLHVFGHVF